MDADVEYTHMILLSTLFNAIYLIMPLIHLYVRCICPILMSVCAFYHHKTWILCTIAVIRSIVCWIDFFTAQAESSCVIDHVVKIFLINTTGDESFFFF
jgi:hypothetical protein